LYKCVIFSTVSLMYSDLKNYEIAYLLSSALSEEEVSVAGGKLSKLIEDAKGMIRRVEIPKKRQLAYPINKERSAYFGWITFAIHSGSVKDIKKRLEGIAELLRSMIVEEVEAPQRQFLRTIPSRPNISAKPSSVPIVPRAEEKDERLDLEALDKKLEEILGK